MDQPPVTKTATNEADTINLDALSPSGSSTPHHRHSHGRAHRRHETHHHRVSQRRSRAQCLGEVRDFEDNALSPRAPQHPPHHSPHSHRHSPHYDEAHHHDGAPYSTSIALHPSRGPTLSHPSYGEDHSDDVWHHGGRRHHGRHHCGGPHQHSEVSHPNELHHQDKPYDYKEPQRSDGPHQRSEARPHGSHQHREAHHHGRSFHHGEIYSHHSSVASDHHGTPQDHERHHSHRGEHHHGEHHHAEHRRSAHYDHLHSDQRYRDHQHGTSQVSDPHKFHSMVSASLHSACSHSGPLQLHEAHAQSLAHGLTHSRGMVLTYVSQISSEVHPLNSSSKISESWTEDEQTQKRKTSRAQRAHKKLHTADLFHWLWEKLSHLIQDLRRMLRNLTESLVFEAFIFLVICLNTIMLVAQTFAEVEIRGEWYFMALDSIFLCIYVVEAVLKIIALGLKYFSDSWNNLDFFIVVMAVLDFMLMQLSSLSSLPNVYNQSIFRIFRVFKSLRALRAILVLRRLSFLTSLHIVTRNLARSLPSIAAVLILMFTCLLLFSVVLRALFHQSDPKRFQNIFTTIFTLFTLLTLDDWSLIYLDSQAQDPEEVMSEHTTQKQLIEKKLGTMTEKQQELLVHFLQLVAGVEHHQQKFRSQASIIDEIVDTAFEASLGRPGGGRGRALQVQAWGAHAKK
ncbi:Cation Channel Sperm-Associated Protein 1 [Manis pentadactyla]|nr:Cation Channel Sperm-Associated Protein 1 [Manis pentadactyla]